MQLSIRRTFVICDHKMIEMGQESDKPLIRVGVVTVIENPYSGRYVADLTPLIKASVELGETMTGLAIEAMGSAAVESYGKGGIVGTAGEQEHINALLTTEFAKPLRDAIGNGLAWIPSYTKLAAPGATIDIPLAHKDALYVRSHYDGMTIAMPPDVPAADEIAAIICIANRGRLNARVGGLRADAISVWDGLS